MVIRYFPILSYISASWFIVWIVGLFVIMSFFGLQSGTEMWMSGIIREGGMYRISHVWFMRNCFVAICSKCLCVMCVK